MVKRHPSKPRNPSDYAEQEIEANIYSYNKSGHPAGLRTRLKGIIQVVAKEYDIYYYESYKIVFNVMKKHVNKIPKRWKDDLVHVRKELESLYKKKNLKDYDWPRL
jgi:hypothetical protein